MLCTKNIAQNSCASCRKMREQIFCGKIIQILRKKYLPFAENPIWMSPNLWVSKKKSQRKSPMTSFGSPMKYGCLLQNLGSQWKAGILQ